TSARPIASPPSLTPTAVPESSQRRASEPLAVGGGRDAEALRKDPPHRARVAEAGARGDLLEGQRRLLEQAAHLVDAQAAHQRGGRFAEVLAAPAAEGTRAQAGAARDPLDR